MKWWDRMPWSSFFECWVLSQLFSVFIHFHQEAFLFFFTFCHKGGVICISEVIGISPGNLVSSLCFIQFSIFLMYSACKLNKQGNNIQPWQYTSFSSLEPVYCSMSSSNGCFLAYIQVSQESRKVVWYSHLFKNFPQIVGIHTVKGFGIVNEAEVDVFLEFFLLFLWSNPYWQFDLWFLCLF